jgi:hypothetical protein
LTTSKGASRSAQHQGALAAVIDALATYRLTVLIKDDKITQSLRDFVFDRYGHLEEDDVRNPSYLMGCPWCLSIYFGALAVAGRRFAPGAWRTLSSALALSATTGLLAEAVAAAQRHRPAPRSEEASA